MMSPEVNTESADDEIDKLEKDVKRRLNVVSGLLKLRGQVSRAAYKEHFEKAKEQFDEIARHVANVQDKIDRELALLHQAKGVVQANQLQQLVVNEVHNQLQTSETLRAISELRRSADDARTRGLQRQDSGDYAATKNETKEPDDRSTASKTSAERLERPLHNKKPGRGDGSYSRNRDTFNRYIL